MPPGRISSAARNPVSPGPAASSSTRWPGCSARARSSRPTPASRTRACGRRACPTRRPRAPSARGSRRERVRIETLTAARRRVGRAPPPPRDLLERALDLRAQPPLEDRHQRLGRDRSRAAPPRARSRASARRACRPARTASRSRARTAHERARHRIAVAVDVLEDGQRAAQRDPASPRPPRRSPAATGSGPRSGRRRSGTSTPSRSASASTSRRLLRADAEPPAELVERQRLGRARRAPARSAPRPKRSSRSAVPWLSSSSRLIAAEVEAVVLEVADQPQLRDVLGPVVADPRAHLGRRRAGRAPGGRGCCAPTSRTRAASCSIVSWFGESDCANCAGGRTRPDLASWRRSSLPDGVRGSRVGELDRLGHLERARAARAQCARSSSGATLRAVAQHDASPRPPRPTPGPGARCTAASATAGMLEQHRLDLGRRDVLAAADDRVGLAADDLEPSPRRRSRRGRRCAASRLRTARRRDTIGPRDEDLAVAGDPHLDSRRAASRTWRSASTPRSCRRSAPPARRPRAPARAAPARSGRRRAAPSAASAVVRRPASSSRASIVGTSETSVIRRAGSISVGQHRLGVEALVEDRGRGVDRAADRDRQAADVGQRHRAQPALARVEAERHRGAERAGQEVAEA